jgi:hypothetical protein
MVGEDEQATLPEGSGVFSSPQSYGLDTKPEN